MRIFTIVKGTCIIVWLALIVTAFVACARKSLPEISHREIVREPAAKTDQAIQPAVVTGKAIFISRCHRCHDLPDPAQYTVKRWESILTYMIPKAKLNREEGIHVKAFLMNNAAD